MSNTLSFKIAFKMKVTAQQLKSQYIVFIVTNFRTYIVRALNYRTQYITPMAFELMDIWVNGMNKRGLLYYES